jgi:hypothetical protein
MREDAARAVLRGGPRRRTPRRGSRRSGRVRCKRSCPASLGFVAPTGAGESYRTEEEFRALLQAERAAQLLRSG